MQFCQGDNLTGISYSSPATSGSSYVWTATNGAVVSGQGSPNVTVNWNPAGERTLSLTQCLGTNCETETIQITVSPTFSVEEEATICQGQSIFLGGANQTQPGVYTDIFQTVNGCDSTIVTTLSVVESIQVEDAVTICNGESLFVGGANQTTSGQYIDTFTSVSGCDSIVTTNLTVLAPISVNEEAEVCQGGSIFLAGDFQSTPGNYTEVFESVFGCDSVVVTNLSIIPAPIVEETVEICPGQSYFVGGAEQTEPGQYSDTISDTEGCETVVITTLVVESSVVVNESATICQGQSIFLGGAEQTEPGQYTDFETDAEGCEITIITTLTVEPPVVQQATAEICQGQRIFLGGANQTQAGVYTDTSTDANGCDVIIETTLTVTPPVVQQATAEICQGQSIFLGGAEQTEPGVYTDMSTDANGCEVITETTLTVNPPVVVTAEAQICEGQSIFLGGANQTEPGVYTDMSTDANGCDIIVETTLEVVSQITVGLSEAICQGDSLFVGGAWQNSPGDYVDSFVGVGGCDSIVTTTLAFLPAINVEETASVCEGDSLFVGGAWQFEAGSYTDSFTTESGCDSVITTLLSLLPVPQPEIEFTGGVLTTGQAASYQWYFNGMLINGAVNQFYVPDLQGDYTVVVTNADGCSGESEPFTYITDHVGLLNRDANMSVYPNPGNGFFRVDRDWHDDALLEVYDLTGRMVRAQVHRVDHGWTVDLTGNASGTYIFMVRSSDYVARQRVMLTN